MAFICKDLGTETVSVIPILTQAEQYCSGAFVYFGFLVKKKFTYFIIYQQTIKEQKKKNFFSLKHFFLLRLSPGDTFYHFTNL